MARASFGKTPADFTMVVGPAGQMRVTPAALTFWDAEVGGTQFTDLLLNGAPVSSITTPVDGEIPLFEGPDGVVEMWVDAGGGRLRLVASGAESAAAAQAAATAAEAAATEAEDAVTAAVPKSLIDAKGDLIVGTAADTPGRLAVGANGRQLFADSTQATGLRWGAEGQLPVAGVIGDGVDVDTLTTPGMYFRGSSVGVTTVLHYPLDVWAGWIEVSVQAGTMVQRAISITTESGFGTTRSNQWFRTRFGGIWQPWVEVRTSAPRPGNTMTGTGFPESVVTAPVGTKYVDTAATNGAVEWVKASGAGNTGWRVVYGDTGWRDISAELVNGWTGQGGTTGVAVRRLTNAVVFRYRSLNGQNATSTTLWVPAVGFRVESADGQVAMFGSAPALLQINTTPAVVCPTGVASGGNGSIQWTPQASQPWPPSLPGNPV